MKNSEFKAIKINNAAWLPQIAGHIEQFCKKAHVDGIQPGNLQTYFAQIAQGWYGRNSELWAVFDENEKPVGFAAWMVMGLPHIAKVYCFALHVWTKDPHAAKLLMDGFVAFGVKHNAIWYSADVVSKSLIRLLRRAAGKLGFSIAETGLTHLTATRRLK